jgi:hypothetical protein
MAETSIKTALWWVLFAAFVAVWLIGIWQLW